MGAKICKKYFGEYTMSNSIIQMLIRLQYNKAKELDFNNVQLSERMNDTFCFEISYYSIYKFRENYVFNMRFNKVMNQPV